MKNGSNNKPTPNGTAFDQHSNHVDPLRAQRSAVQNVTAGALRGYKMKAAFAEALRQKANPDEAQAWFLSKWVPRGGERFFFVTDNAINLCRNLGTPYIIELVDKSDPPGQTERVRHYKYRRNIPVFLVEPFNETSLQNAAHGVEKLFS